MFAGFLPFYLYIGVKMGCKVRGFGCAGARALSLFAVCVFASGFAAAQGERMPNIIFIVADDMGFGDSIAHNPDSKIPLPNLAQLANEGVTFTRAYTATPKCAPSRYSYLTGNYQWRGRGSFGWWNFVGGSQVIDGQKTIANILRPNYDTSMVGKYHLGGSFYSQGSDSYLPYNGDPALADFGRPMEDGARDRGFDYSYILLRGIQDPPYAYFENDVLASPLAELTVWEAGWHNTYSRILKTGIGAGDFDTTEEGEIFMNAALAHLTEIVSQADHKPFFFYYPAIAAHHPTTPPDYFYGTPIFGTQFSRRADMLVQLDASLGLLLDFLDENNLAEDTLIIFTSDNGGAMDTRQSNIDDFGHDTNGGLRGGKGDIWDGGVRIPLVMRWGDGTPVGSTIPPGTVSNTLIALQDIPATISALNGKNPGHGQMKDSYNLLGELLNPGSNGMLRESLILEARNSNGAFVPKHFAIVEQDWKLVLDDADQPSALFNMQLDGNETNNLLPSGTYADVAERLREKLLLLRASGRTAPVLDLVPQDFEPSGQPELLDEDEGIFVWGSGDDGTLGITVKSAVGAIRTTEVVLVADHAFESIQAIDLEGYIDEIDWDGDRRIAFTSHSTGAADGFTVKLPKGAIAVAHVSESSDIDGMMYGADKQNRGSQLILNNRRGVTEAIQPGMNAELIEGKPVLSDMDQGIFLWSEANDGTFEIAIKGAIGETLAAEVEIIADHDFEEVEAVSLEASDTLEWLGGNRIRLTSDAVGEADGFRAKLPQGSTFLTIISGPNAENELTYGPDKAIAKPNAWQLPLAALAHDGSSESGRLLANASIAASSGMPDQVELRWRGDGSGTAFFVDLLFNETVTGAALFNDNTPYQNVDVTPRSVSSAAFLMDETGGVDLQVPGASNIGIYFHDANGQIPDYLLNLPGGLGAPNAHRVKLAEPIGLPPGC